MPRGDAPHERGVSPSQTLSGDVQLYTASTRSVACGLGAPRSSSAPHGFSRLPTTSGLTKTRQQEDVLQGLEARADSVELFSARVQVPSGEGGQKFEAYESVRCSVYSGGSQEGPSRASRVNIMCRIMTSLAAARHFRYRRTLGSMLLGASGDRSCRIGRALCRTWRSLAATPDGVNC
jgi:hypothetical protein